MNVNMSLIPRQQTTPHMHHNPIPYIQNAKQQPPGLHGTNVQNHLRNINTMTSPVQNAQPYGQQEMNVSLTQLHQNLYKTCQMPLEPKPQVCSTVIHWHLIII